MIVKGNTITEQLRSALKTCGQSVYSINKACGIDEGSLSKFLHGQVGLSLKNVDLLAQHLNLSLVQSSTTNPK